MFVKIKWMNLSKKENILGTLNKNYLQKKLLKSIGLCPWQFDLYKKKVFFDSFKHNNNDKPVIYFAEASICVCMKINELHNVARNFSSF